MVSGGDRDNIVPDIFETYEEEHLPFLKEKHRRNLWLLVLHWVLIWITSREVSV